VGVHKAFVRVHLDEKAASGATDVLLDPHEITQIDEPKPEKHLQAKVQASPRPRRARPSWFLPW
jgi:hypothetical protein